MESKEGIEIVMSEAAPDSDLVSHSDAKQIVGGPEKTAPTPGTLYLVAPVLARWYLY